MKSIPVLFCLCFVFYVCSCNAEEIQVQETDMHAASAVSKTLVTESPDIIKLKNILNTMEFPAKEKILSSADAFLEDLQYVLFHDTERLLLLVDKNHFLTEDYIPADLLPLEKNAQYQINRTDLSLRTCARNALDRMADAARKDGITLVASSSYRSYAYQKNLYKRNVNEMGEEAASRESAKPGSSQHQLGTVVDFGSITDAFAQTAAGLWMTQNAHLYGFSLSFPEGYEDITGYRWESWHYRYIGPSAVAFQRKWFADIQQYMLEFIYAYQAK